MTDIEETIEREGEDIPIMLDIEWKYDAGEYIEPGHFCNGYGRGWRATLTARDLKTNTEIPLTDDEIERFQEKYPPSEDGPDEDFQPA